MPWCKYHAKPAEFTQQEGKQDFRCEDSDGTYGNHCVPLECPKCGAADIQGKPFCFMCNQCSFIFHHAGGAVDPRNNGVGRDDDEDALV